MSEPLDTQNERKMQSEKVLDGAAQLRPCAAWPLV